MNVEITDLHYAEAEKIVRNDLDLWREAMHDIVESSESLIAFAAMRDMRDYDAGQLWRQAVNGYLESYIVTRAMKLASDDVVDRFLERS